MIYILYGTEELLIDKYIENLIQEKNIDNIIKYNLEETLIDNIIEDASYMDLFGNDKIIIVNDSSFLSSTGSLETDELEKYLNNPNDKTILIFIVNSEKLDERKKLVKFLKNNSNVRIEEFNKLEGFNLEKYIKDSFETDDYNIDLNCIKTIVSLLNGEFKFIDNEIKKLKLFKLDEKTINIKDVESVVTRLPEDNIFKLVDAVAENDKERMFSIYKDLIDNNEEPIKLIVMLANHFRLLYQVKILLSEGLKQYEIASELGIHPYRVKLSMEKANKYEDETLLNILSNLADIDYEIKSGLTDKNRALEMFFLEL